MSEVVSKSEYDQIKAAYDQVSVAYNQVSAKYEALRYEFERLKKLLYGSKRERFVPDSTPAEQLHLDFGEMPTPTSTETPADTEHISYERKKPQAHPGRTSLPDNLPVEEIIIEPAEDVSNMVYIGSAITETIDYQPGVLKKVRYIRKKYAQPTEEAGKTNIVIADMPNRPLPKAIAEAGLLAHLLVSKFVDHLPFYRQIEQFRRNYGWTIPKSTLNNWFADCCVLLEPLYQKHIQQTLSGHYLQVDESPIKVLDADKKDGVHQGYMWVYRNPISQSVLFDYRKGRGMHGPKERLSQFSGILQTDGYAVYPKIAQHSAGKIQLISCMAHIRRKFYEAQQHHPDLARQALAQIKQLYELEACYRQQPLSATARQLRRQQEARPIFDQLLAWVSTQKANNLSKGPIGQALHYAQQQLPLLSAYLDNGHLEIDNNLIENAIRPLALGRKNYLFAGAHSGAERAAMMYSFFATCKVNGIDPWEWLQDVFTRIAQHPVNQLEKLLPHHWKNNQPIDPPTDLAPTPS